MFCTTQVGALISGTVRRIEPFGVFIGISGTRVSGLLHISNISRCHVGDPTVSKCMEKHAKTASDSQRDFLTYNLATQTVFKVGEEVWGLVMAMDDNFSNISLSTAELEPEEGDIMSDKAAVWAQAGKRSPNMRASCVQIVAVHAINPDLSLRRAEEQSAAFRRQLAGADAGEGDSEGAW